MRFKEWLKGSSGLVRMSALQRLSLALAQALVLLLVVTGLALYNAGMDSSERTAIDSYNRNLANQVRGWSDGEALPVELGEGLLGSLDRVMEILEQQRQRSQLYTYTLLVVTAAGLVIVLCVSYLVVKSIGEKYPELREER